LSKWWFCLLNAIFSNRAATPNLPATLYLESILNEAKGAQTAIAPQQPFLLLFALSSLPCVSKAASSAPKIIQKFQAEGCYAVFSGLHFSRVFLPNWEMQSSENLLGFEFPLPTTILPCPLCPKRFRKSLCLFSKKLRSFFLPHLSGQILPHGDNVWSYPYPRVQQCSESSP